MVIALLRVSTDRQDVERQRQAIQAYADENGLKISEWIEDTESRDNAQNRPGFQRLLRLVQDGKVSLVLIDKFERIGVSGPDEFMYYRWIFIQGKCKIYSVGDALDLTAPDYGNVFKGFFAADASRAEQQNISHRGLSGRLLKAQQGEHCGGMAPLGYDKVCLDPNGALLWRLIRETKTRCVQVFANGHKIIHEGKGASPRKSKNEKLLLAPNPDQAPLVQRIFRLWTTERISLLGLACKLNRDGFTIYGRPFYSTTVKKILQNEKYLGKAVWYKHLQGRFKELRNGRTVDISDEAKARMKGKKKKYIPRKADASQVVTKDGAHEAIIEVKTFAYAQEKIRQLKDNKLYAPKTDFWLKDLVFCGHCGKPMRRETHKGKTWLTCSTYVNADKHGLAHAAACTRNTVQVKEVEAHIESWLEAKKEQLFANPDLDDVTKTFGILEECHSAEKSLPHALDSGAWQSYLDGMRADLKFDGGFPEYDHFLATTDSLRSCVSFKDRLTDLVKLDELKCALADLRLEQVEKEYLDVCRSKSRATSDREESLWQREQKRLEALQDRLQMWQRPLVQRYQELVKRLEDMTPRLMEIKEALAGGSPRQKAELIRGVLSKIELFFTVGETNTDKIRRITEANPKISSRDIAEALAKQGIHLPTKAIATLRQRTTCDNPRKTYTLSRLRLQSSLVETPDSGS